MNQQAKLFYEDEADAIQQMIGASGKSIKACAAFLWPDMKLSSSIAKFHARLDRNGDERFSFGQVLALMTFCGTYDPLYYACDELMHARPDRKSLKDDEVKLIEAITNAGETLRAAMAQLERVKGKS